MTGKGANSIVNYELLCSSLAPLGACCLPAGPFESGRQWRGLIQFLRERWLFQAYQAWRFERALKDAQTSARTIQQPASSPLPARAEADRARAEGFGIDGLSGSPLGRIEISSIGLAAMIRVTYGSVRREVG